MKQTITRSQFHDAFRIRPTNFSYAGLNELFDYLEEYEDSTGEELELDVIALCCDFSEYENLEEFQNNYGTDYESMEDIEQETIVVPVGKKGFIIQDF